MEKAIKIFNAGSTIIAIITGLMSLYFYFDKPTPVLGVIPIDVHILSSENEIMVNDSIRNTWYARYKIKNIGKNTIVGDGKNSVIIGDGIRVNYTPTPSKTISSTISQNEIDAYIDDGVLKFKQWRRNESIEIDAVIESDTEPSLLISDRDIMDLEIEYIPKITAKIRKGERTGILNNIPYGFLLIIRFVYLSLMFLYTVCLYALIKSRKTNRQLKIMLWGLIVLLWLGSLVVMNCL